MYKMSFDLTNKKHAAFITDEPGATIRIDDYETICEIRLGYENFEELESQYRDNIGEMSYRELEEKYDKILEENRKLKAMMAKKELLDEIRMEKLSSDIF